MIRYRETKDYEPSHPSPTTVKRTNVVAGTMDRISLNYYTPEFLRYWSRIWENDGRWTQLSESHVINHKGFKSSRDGWHAVQHYKRYIADNTPFDSEEQPIWVTTPTSGVGSYVSLGGQGVHRLLPTAFRVFRGGYGEFGQHMPSTSSMTVDLKDGAFVPPPIGLSTLVALSLNKMMPDIRSNLSLVNSIIELKDFKSLPHTLSNLGSTLKNLSTFVKKGKKVLGPNPFSIIRKTFKSKDGLTLRELLHSTADGYLQAKFNLLPLFSDMCAIFRAFASLSKTMNRLVSEAGRPLRRHFAYQWLPSQFTSPNVVIDMSDNTGEFAGTVSVPGFSGCYRQPSRTYRFEREVVIYEPVDRKSVV